VKAVGLHRFGGPEVLTVVELPAPHAGPGEVRIRVRAAAVNPADTLIREGRSPIRLHGTAPVIPGLDVAGVIDEIGPGPRTDLTIGAAVLAMVNPTRPAGGGYAEWVVLPTAWVVAAPAGTGHAEAATLPMNGLTALHALDQLALPPGSTVAVTGAAGAVGGYAVQLARSAGHRVLADAAAADVELVRALGAEEVVARGPDVADRFRAAAPDGVDGVVDAAVIGAPLVAAVRAGGALAVVRGDDPQTRAAAEQRGVRLAITFVHAYDGRRDKLTRLRDLARTGDLSLRVGARFRPEQAAEAHRRLAAGGLRGRPVLEF
jgi:NADPH:quinone reductase-like Zn-dependent oxidoreductase